MATITKLATGASVASTVFTDGVWTNEANARVATTDLTAAGSNTYATVTNAGRNKEFSSLWPFVFSTSDIPDSSTINSVSVKLQWKNSVNSTNYTLRSSAFDGSNDSTAVALSANPGVSRSPTPTADTDDTYSLTTVPSLTQLRNGIWIRASALQGGTNTGSTFSLDYIQVTVNYTPPSTSGTVTITEDVDTSTASGAQNNRASAAITEAIDTSTVSGTVNNRGTVAYTEAADTSSASGFQGYTGTASVTEAVDVTGSNILLDAYDQANRDLNQTFSNGTFVGYAQTFQPSVTAFVTSAKFFLIRDTSGAGQLVAKIYNASGGLPTGAALSTSAQINIATDVSTSPTGLVEFTFPGDLQLNSGSTYAVTVELVGTLIGGVSVGSDNSSPTHPGSGSRLFSDSGWLASGSDFIFSVHSVGQGASGTVVLPSVTGTIGVTEAADTASANGTATVVGTSSTTEAADTPSASAIVTVTGTVAATESDDIVSASGDVQTPTIDGTVAITEAADVSSITAIVTLTGTTSIAEADDTSAVVALATNLGAIAVTEQSDTLTGTGRAGDILASESSVEANDAASASGIILIAGVISVVETVDITTASGKLTINGSVVTTESNDIASLSGAVTVTTVTTASTSGTSIILGVGASTVIATGNTSGIATANFIGQELVKQAPGTAIGTSTVTGIGASTVVSVVNSSGTSTVQAIGVASAQTTASISGISTVNGVGASIAAGIGTAVGTENIIATGASTVNSTAIASGTSIVTGLGSDQNPAMSASLSTICSSIAANLFIPKPLAATLTALVSIVPVPLITAIRLNGNLLNTVSPKNSLLTTQVKLSSNVFSLTTLNSNLLVPKPLNSNLVVNTSIVPPSLLTQIRLSGALQNQIASFAEFFTGTITLQGLLISVTNTVVVDLTIPKPLVSSLICNAGQTCNISTGISLNGLIFNLSSTSAVTLDTVVRIFGILQTVSSGISDLLTPKPLDGAIICQSDSTVELATQILVLTEIFSEFSTQSTLNTQIKLNGLSLGSSVGTSPYLGSRIGSKIFVKQKEKIHVKTSKEVTRYKILYKD